MQSHFDSLLSTLRAGIGIGVFALCSALPAKDNKYPAPPLPNIPDRHFKVGQFGAKGDGQADDTRSIQEAIDAAAAASGGVVELSSGEYLCGPLHLANHVNLHVDKGVTLRMLPKEQYPGGTDAPHDFISASKLHDVAITGEGVIDGQGSAWWPIAKVKGAKRPIMLSFSGCDRILIEKVTLRNSPMFHIGVGGRSSNVTVSGVIIRAPASDDPVNPSHNTDACDVSGKHILIRDCDVSVGDDDFTCAGGTSDVLITHCKYGHGHGLSIGSPTKGGVSNFTVEDCTFENTDCGIRIKSDRDRGGVVENLTFQNLRMTNVGFPILIYAAYMATQREYRDLNRLTPEIAATYPAAPITDRTPIYKNITFSNITATAQSGHIAGLIWGLPEAPVSNILLQKVNISADKPLAIYFAQHVRMEDCHIKTPEGIKPIVSTNAEIAGIEQ